MKGSPFRVYLLKSRRAFAPKMCSVLADAVVCAEQMSIWMKGSETVIVGTRRGELCLAVLSGMGFAICIGGTTIASICYFAVFIQCFEACSTVEAVCFAASDTGEVACITKPVLGTRLSNAK